jgi:GMP synthase (glutamine-hydrolysing)
MKSQLLILDYGSQYTQLIARIIRELGVYCEIIPGNVEYSKIVQADPSAIILSGGPASVNSDNAPRAPQELWTSSIPIFAICYGMQLTAQELGGKVEGWARTSDGSQGENSNLSVREFGPAELTCIDSQGPFGCLENNEKISVWMSHGDKVTVLPEGFTTLASSPGSPIAAFGNAKKKIYGVQFHPEVHHTPRGKEIFSKFLFEVAGLKKDWDMKNFISETVDKISEQYPSGNVVCGLSGGVDSTVAAVLVSRAIGERLHCIFVNNGLLRGGEAEQVMEDMTSLGLNVTLVDATANFLDELKGVTDPEKKRKIIGRVFIEVFEKEASRITDAEYLVQGTLYPDVIESVSVFGNSVTIKSHHNVGGLTDNMKLGLIEPLRELFKDEVRAIGRELGIPERMILRQPFPGPGLAVRCIGEVNPIRLEKLRAADLIVQVNIASEHIPPHSSRDLIFSPFPIFHSSFFSGF